MSVDRPPGEFVDTNILIYAFDTTAGDKRRAAVELIARLWLERKGCVSLQVLQEFYVASTRKLILAPEQAMLQVGRLGRWRVHRPSVEDVMGAIELHRRHSVSFCDGLILRSAQASQCSVLWSEDLSSGQRWGNLEVLVRWLCRFAETGKGSFVMTSHRIADLLRTVDTPAQTEKLLALVTDPARDGYVRRYAIDALGD